MTTNLDLLLGVEQRAQRLCTCSNVGFSEDKYSHAYGCPSQDARMQLHQLAEDAVRECAKVVTSQGHDCFGKGELATNCHEADLTAILGLLEEEKP